MTGVQTCALPICFPVTICRFNIFNEKTGEVFPMFIQVPCGKCVLCRDKKAREWSFRATCENVFSESIPLFLTLTYNNENLPKHGVFKEEVQLFLSVFVYLLNVQHIFWRRDGLINNNLLPTHRRVYRRIIRHDT